MVRTMAGGQRKAVASKAPRKTMASSSSSSSGGSGGSSSIGRSPGRAGKAKARSAGHNAITKWDAPKWQKSVSQFFQKKAEVSVTKQCEVSSTSELLREPSCSQDSCHTVDLNETPQPTNIAAIFADDAEEAGPSSSGSSCDDVERPGPSNRF